MHKTSNDNHKIKYLSSSQLKSFLFQCKKSSLRDYLLFLLTYRYGLRREEVRILDWGKINLNDGTMWVTAVKHGNSCEYKLSDDEVKLLKQYRKTLPSPILIDTPVFRSERGKRICRAQIHNLFVKYRKLARIPKGLSCHSLRHSVAMSYLNSGVATATLDFVQKHLRHRDIRSTQVYAHMLDSTAEKIRNEVRNTTDAIV